MIARADPVDDAVEQLENGDAQGAAEVFAALVEQTPENLRVWYGLGRAQLELGAYAEAENTFTRGLAVTPDAGLWYNLACARSLRGEVDGALEALRSAVAAGYGSARHAHTDPDLERLRAVPEALDEVLAPLDAVDLLSDATRRDGVWVSRSVLEARAAALCRVRSAVGCALAPLGAPAVDVRDPAALRAVLAPLCDAGDGVACLGKAWTLLPPSLGRAAPLSPSPEDLVAVVDGVKAACDAGVSRGCVELGWVYALGWWSYPWERGAKHALWKGCVQDVAAGCVGWSLRFDPPKTRTLERETAESASAWVEGARFATTRAQRDEFLAGACEAGVAAACAEVARDGATLPAWVATACAEGDAAACALGAGVAASKGQITVDEALARYDAACSVLPSACDEAAFLRQGAPPVASYPPPPKAPAVARGMYDAAAPLHACLRALLVRDRTAEGVVPAVLRVGPDGRVAAVSFPSPVDTAWRLCATDAVRTAAKFDAQPLPGRIEVEISLAHAAEVKVDSLVTDGGREISVVAEDVPTWGAALDACAIERGVVFVEVPLVLEVFARRDGRYSDIVVTRSIEEPEIEACVVDWLSAHVADKPVAIGTKIRAEVTFVAPVAHPPPPLPGAPRIAAAHPEATFVAEDAGPVHPKILVLSVVKGVADGRKGKLGPRSIASIEAAHEAFGEAVARMTHGAVVPEHTFRTVDATVVSALDEEGGGDRFRLSLNDLPPALLRAVEPGVYDSIFVWGAIPRGYPRPALGTTYGGELLGGATFSTGFLPSKAALDANLEAPPYELVLHEWWHQVAGRAEALVGTRSGGTRGFPPDNHERLRAGGRWLEPRTWLGDASTVVAWYEEVLGAMPAGFWADVWSRGERVAASPTNLALGALPFGGGVYHEDGLRDTVLAFGDYGMPHAADDAEAPWFGLAFDGLTSIGRVEVVTGSEWKGAEIDVVSTFDGGEPAWVDLDVSPTRTERGLSFVFPAQEVLAVRVRPSPGKGAVCRELEVYAL